MTALKLIDLGPGQVGIVGHAGCGHANSHLGFIQDDSGGLSAVTDLLQQATSLDLRISEIQAVTGRKNAEFIVKTACGGIGRASARRGITAAEARLAQYIVGRPAINSQALSMEAMGRTLGQGAMEVPVALQTAIANASMDSFIKNFPDQFLIADEALEGNIGKILGCRLEIDGIPVSVLALANATEGGLGPNEDIEGNVNLYGKKEIMQEIGLDRLPSFVVEGKVCADPVSSEISQPTFLIRSNTEDDNQAIGRCLKEAADELGFPAVWKTDVLKRSPVWMENLTREMGEKVMDIGRRIAQAKTSREKVLLSAELNRFASEELGGITFMSNDVHTVMGGVGCIPGSSAVLSLFIPHSQLERDVYPSLTLEDCDKYVELLCQGVKVLKQNLPEAQEKLIEVQEKFHWKP